MVIDVHVDVEKCHQNLPDDLHEVCTALKTETVCLIDREGLACCGTASSVASVYWLLQGATATNICVQ